MHTEPQSDTSQRTAPAADEYLSRAATADFIGRKLRGKPLAVITLKRWQRDGMGPPITKVGRTVSYRLQSVENWLRAQESAA